MGTRKDRNSEIDEDAVHVVEGILRGEDWNRSKPQPDKVGLDKRVDLLEDRHPQINFYLQIKGMGPKTAKGKKQPLVSHAGTLNKKIELEHLDYYMKLPTPVFLVVVDVVGRVAYHVHVQRYVLEELKSDDWQDRLRAHNEARGRQRSKRAPTKTIRVPVKNILSDTSTFRDAVRDAKGYMASLLVDLGIIYREAIFAQLDERFKVTYVRGRDGEHFQIDAKEPVEMKMQGKLPKKKCDEMFGRGLPVNLDPGEMTIQGSPLWEKIASESKAIHIKQERQGFINIIRLDETGKPIARLEYLVADIEGGFDEWRFKVDLPNKLFKIEFNLDFGAIRDNPTSRLHMTSTLKYRNNLAAYLGLPVANLEYIDHAVKAFSELMDTDRIRFELGLPGIGILGGFTLPQEMNQLIAGIGLLYGSLNKARAIGNFFKIDLKIPAKLSNDDLDDIDFLYELTEGGDVPPPRRIVEVTVQVLRDRVESCLDALPKRNSSELVLVSDGQFTCLGETINVDKLVQRITQARLVTTKSEIERMLRESSETITLQFETTPESKQIVRLADLAEAGSAKTGVGPSDSGS